MRYLNNAALGAMTEPAVMSMNHGFRTISKGFLAMLNPSPEFRAIKNRHSILVWRSYRISFWWRTVKVSR